MKKAFTAKAKVLLLLLLAVAGVAKAQQWRTLNTGVTEDLYDICCIDENTIFVSGQNGVILKTEDGGATWQEKHRNPDWEIISIKFANDSIGYGYVAHNYNRFLIKTIDSGETWFTVSRNFPELRIIDDSKDYSTIYWTMYGKPAELHLTNNNVMFVSRYGGHLTRSIDGGATFSSVDLGFDPESRVFAFFEENVGLAMGYEKYNINVLRIMRTDDYGDQWENIANYEFSINKPVSVYFENESHIKVFGEFCNPDGYYGVLETNDGFEHIMMYGYNSDYYSYFDVDFFNERGCYINSIEVDKDPLIYSEVQVTEDGGTSWFEVVHGLNTYQFMYCVSATNSNILIASQNGKLYKYDNTPVQGVEENEANLSIFPNPVGQTLEISVKNAQKIEIMDNLGRKIMDLQTGQDHIMIDFSRFEQGIYYVVATDENGMRHIGKVIKKSE